MSVAASGNIEFYAEVTLDLVVDLNFSEVGKSLRL